VLFSVFVLGVGLVLFFFLVNLHMTINYICKPQNCNCC
jgi:hypothetical protein